MQIWKSPFLKTKVFSTNFIEKKYLFLIFVFSLVLVLLLASIVEQKINPIANISHNSGKYNEPFELTVDYGIGTGKIRYTLNGEDPTIASPEYQKSIPIRTTTVVKTALFNKEGKIKSPIQKRTFIYTNHDLPIVSLITEPKNLWDPETGIYIENNNLDNQLANYDQRGENWRRQIHVDVIDESGNIALATGAEIRLFGGSTRRYEQKSFKICAKEKYGSRNLGYDFFNTGEIRHRCILLRNSGNDWKSTMLRDSLVHKIIEDTNLDNLKSQPAVVYLNGEYWGIYNIREFYDDNYLHNKYGVNRNSITLLEQSLEHNSYPKLREGSKESEEKYFELFDNLNNPSYLKQNIDTKNFVDFFLTNIYLANSDFTTNNIRVWRLNTQVATPLDKEPLDGKWRWLPYDMDYTMGFYEEGDVKENSFKFTPNKQPSNRYLIEDLLRTLLKDEEFKHYFLNRYADLLNTTFQTEKNIQTFKELEKVYRSEIPRHTARWGQDSGIETIAVWNENIDKIEDYFKNDASRSKEYVIQEFGLSGIAKVYVNLDPNNGGYVKINSINTRDQISKETLEYFKDIPIKVEAVPDFGYKFVGWSDPSLGNEKFLEMVLTQDIELKPIFESYLGDNQ